MQCWHTCTVVRQTAHHWAVNFYNFLISIALEVWKICLNVTTLVSLLPILYITSHDSSVATVTRLRATRLTNSNSVPTEYQAFRLLRNFRRVSGRHPAFCSVDKDSFHRRWRGWALNLATNLYQVSRLRMTGVIPPPHMLYRPAWRRPLQRQEIYVAQKYTAGGENSNGL